MGKLEFPQGQILSFKTQYMYFVRATLCVWNWVSYTYGVVLTYWCLMLVIVQAGKGNLCPLCIYKPRWHLLLSSAFSAMNSWWASRRSWSFSHWSLWLHLKPCFHITATEESNRNACVGSYNAHGGPCYFCSPVTGQIDKWSYLMFVWVKKIWSSHAISHTESTIYEQLLVATADDSLVSLTIPIRCILVNRSTLL